MRGLLMPPLHGKRLPTYSRLLLLQYQIHWSPGTFNKEVVHQRAQQALGKLRPIVERHNCSLAQLSLAWLIAQPQTNAIAGALHRGQSFSNAKEAEVKLSQEEVQEIDVIGRIVTEPLDDNPMMWDWNSQQTNNAPDAVYYVCLENSII